MARSTDLTKSYDSRLITNLAECISKLGTHVSRDDYNKWNGRIANARTISTKHKGWERAKSLAIDSLSGRRLYEMEPEKPQEMRWNEWLEFAINTKETLKREDSFGSQIAEKKLPRSPSAIVFSSDWHLGSISTNYETFRNNIQYLMDNTDLYMVVVGDTIDNFLQFPDKTAVLQQIINPMYQKKMLKSIIDELVRKGKIIATGWGDHDSRFEEKLNGSDVIKMLSEKKIPYFAGKGVLKLKIGSQEYTCAVTHKSRFNSYLNETHGSSQEYRNFIPADICVTGHLHTPAFSVCHRLPMAREAGMKCGGQVILIRTGSYKEDDAYSLRYWSRGIIGTPTVVLYGDEWNLIPFATAELAVGFMNAKKK